MRVCWRSAGFRRWLAVLTLAGLAVGARSVVFQHAEWAGAAPAECAAAAELLADGIEGGDRDGHADAVIIPDYLTWASGNGARPAESDCVPVTGARGLDTGRTAVPGRGYHEGQGGIYILTRWGFQPLSRALLSRVGWSMGEHQFRPSIV